jgi:hypothetical protein
VLNTYLGTTREKSRCVEVNDGLMLSGCYTMSSQESVGNRRAASHGWHPWIDAGLFLAYLQNRIGLF